MNKKFVLLAIFVLLILILSACGSANPMKNVPFEKTGKVYGFWNGLWDGLTSIFAFIGNLFGGHFGLYQVHNNGNWYDLGFLISAGTVLRFVSIHVIKFNGRRTNLHV